MAKSVGPALGSKISEMMKRDPGSSWKPSGKRSEDKATFNKHYDETFGVKNIFKNLADKN